jgi:tRNA-Thr(GGU) m(6)t(6)A37 methyltransferase TsaA
MSEYNFKSIAIIHSCYKEKFGIPRQPGLIMSKAVIEMGVDYSQQEAFRNLETFSHILVVFVFHGIKAKKWKSTVRPPRLGGNQRVGVFASRSMFRPNPIGLSVVELQSIEKKGNKLLLNIIGGDFLDATPVLDIKPYIPYADAISKATVGYAIEKPEIKFSVSFSQQVKQQLEKLELLHPKITLIITQILQLDPRPAYKDECHEKDEFAMKLYDFDLKWHIDNKNIIVTTLTLLD